LEVIVSFMGVVWAKVEVRAAEKMMATAAAHKSLQVFIV
jgi:hypothetical protein